MYMYIALKLSNSSKVDLNMYTYSLINAIFTTSCSVCIGLQVMPFLVRGVCVFTYQCKQNRSNECEHHPSMKEEVFVLTHDVRIDF